MSKEIIILLLIGLVIAGKLENNLLSKENMSLKKSLEVTNLLYGEQDKIINNILKNE